VRLSLSGAIQAGEVSLGILGFSVDSNLKVKMWPCGEPGASHGSNNITSSNSIADLNIQLSAMSIMARQARCVSHDNDLSVPAERVSVDNLTRSNRPYWSAHGGRQIDSVVMVVTLFNRMLPHAKITGHARAHYGIHEAHRAGGCIRVLGCYSAT
jgi:imidazoleglycerol phosphate dehydratase HisB